MERRILFPPFGYAIANHHQKDSRRKNLGDKTLHLQRVLVRGKKLKLLALMRFGICIFSILPFYE